MEDFPRNKVPLRFLSAFSFGCPRVNREFLDDALAWRLLAAANKGDDAAAKQLDFMARFNEEFHRCYFREGKASKAVLHNTPDLQRKLQDSINAKRKDLWGSKNLRVPLSANNFYPDLQAVPYEAVSVDERLLGAIAASPLARSEIVALTGIKKWIVYARIKHLVEYGLVRSLKRQKRTDLIRFISTKCPA